MQILWRHMTAVRFIASHLGNQNIAQFFLSNTTLNESDQEPVKHWLGDVRTLDPAVYRSPLSTDSLYASPSFEEPKRRWEPWNSAHPVDGWRWGPGSDELPPELHGLRLHGGLMNLQENVLFQSRELSADERGVMQLARCVHTTTGRTGFFTVKMHAAIAGCGDTDVLKALRKHRPCCQYIHPALGAAMEEGQPNAEPCGKSRWCPSCESAHEALFHLPHAHDFIDHVTAWLSVCVQSWTGKGSPTFVDGASCPEHECSASCSVFPTSGA